jgi:hypothetical protein
MLKREINVDRSEQYFGLAFILGTKQARRGLLVLGV